MGASATIDGMELRSWPEIVHTLTRAISGLCLLYGILAVARWKNRENPSDGCEDEGSKQ